MNLLQQHTENLSKPELQELVEKLSHDTGYDCWTRPGLEYIAWPEIQATARWIIFADLDFLHSLNDTWGHDEMDRRIREAMRLRKADVKVAGRRYSGDELLWILCDDPERGEIDPVQTAERLREAFQQFGISATFGIARVMSYDLMANVLPAKRIVDKAKKQNRRGTINQTGVLR